MGTFTKILGSWGNSENCKGYGVIKFSNPLTGDMDLRKPPIENQFCLHIIDTYQCCHSCPVRPPKYTCLPDSVSSFPSPDFISQHRLCVSNLHVDPTWPQQVMGPGYKLNTPMACPRTTKTRRTLLLEAFVCSASHVALPRCAAGRLWATRLHCSS